MSWIRKGEGRGEGWVPDELDRETGGGEDSELDDPDLEGGRMSLSARTEKEERALEGITPLRVLPLPPV